MTRRKVLIAFNMAVLVALPGRVLARPLKTDETVLFIPGYARETGDGLVELAIRAWVFEFERRPGARNIFTELLDIDLNDETPETRAIFAERSRWFLTDSERGKTLTIAFDGIDATDVSLPATDQAGRVDHGIRVPVPAGTRKIRFHTGRKGQRFEGQAFVLPETGLSVVSDIDDTIKISNVADTRALLRGSMMAPFKPAPGMAQLYRDIAREAGNGFHYLSASPIQLLPALLDFLDHEGFPEGSLHLRESTAWNRLVPSESKTPEHKGGTLARLLADFPLRRFLFIGDSGEHDPEIYGDAVRAHPDRDIRILIRDVSARPMTDARCAMAFSGIDPGRWHVMPESGPGPDGLPFKA